MQMLYALLGYKLLRPRRRRHPLDDPLNGREWQGLWRVFAWRAALRRLLRRH